MGYAITLDYPDRSGSDRFVVYDGKTERAADNIKLVTGNNDVGTLTFRIPNNHPSRFSLLAYAVSGPSLLVPSRVVMTHTDDRRGVLDIPKRNATELFVGEVTGFDAGSDGYTTITCKDYLGAFDMLTFRLDQCGVNWGAKNIAELMPSVMTWYNGIHGGFLPDISGCTVVVGYPSGSTTGRTYGRVKPDGTVNYSANLYPDVLHSYDIDRPRTLFDFLVSIAESIGAVVTLEHSGNTCEIVFQAATTRPNAHVYEYGKDIVLAEQYGDWTTYRNAMLATGGTYKKLWNAYTSRDNYTVLRLAESATVGDETLKLRTTSGSVTLTQGTTVATNAVFYGNVVRDAIWYEVQEDVTVTTSSTSVSVSPYVQRELTYSSSSATNVYAWVKSEDDVFVDVGPISPSDPTDRSFYARNGKVIYNKAGVNGHGIRIGEFTDSNITYGTLLADRAVEEIKKYNSTVKTSKSIKFLAVETTHDYKMSDPTSHTTVGTIVHVTHPSLYIGNDIDDDMRVDGMTITVDDPTQNEYIFGTTKHTISKNVSDLDKSIDKRMYDKGVR